MCVFIMKIKFKIISIFLLISSNICSPLFVSDASASAEADDPLMDNTLMGSLMTRYSIGVRDIIAARGGSEEALRKVILGAAQNSNHLPVLLTCYPGGEEAFYERCQTDVFVYRDFFDALTKGFTDHSIFKNYLFSQSDSYFLHYNLYDKNTERERHIRIANFTWHTSAFYKSLTGLKTLPYLSKLLGLDLKEVTIRDKRKNLIQYTLHRAIQYLSPLMQGDIERFIHQNFRSALHFYKKSIIPRDLPQFKKTTYKERRLAEIQLNMYGRYIVGLEKEVNEEQAIRTLENMTGNDKVYGDIRLAEYYFGAFTPGVFNERKATRLLKKHEKSPFANHLVHKILLDHYLGVYREESRNLELADQAIQDFLIATEGYEDLRPPIHLRQGEIALGFYGGDRDIPSAIDYLTKADGFEMLYAIYIGKFGQDYADPDKAEIILNQGVADGFEALCIEKARVLIQQKSPKEALLVLKSMTNQNHASQYMLARLYGNERNGSIYDSAKALGFYINPASINYRDSKKRLLKLAIDLRYSPTSQRQIDDIMAKKFTARLLLDFIKSKNEEEFPKTESKAPEVMIEDTEGRDKGKEEEKVIVDGENHLGKNANEEELSETPILEEIMLVDNTQELVFLSDNIEELMSSLHQRWTWRALTPYLNELGATYPDDQTITFPGVDGVFHFHRAHSGKHSFSLSRGFYKHLRDQIEERYQIMCREAQEKALE